MKLRREGMSISEVIVSMTLLSVILTVLGGVTFTTARQTVANTDASVLQAASVEAVNRYMTMPFAALRTRAGCDTVGGENNRFQRCVAVLPEANAAVVEITTKPLQRFAVTTSTVRFTRVAPTGANSLCRTC